MGNKKVFASKIIKLLEKEYKKPDTTLYNWKTPMQLLVSVILSAQCTDKRVNIVTKELFKKYKTVEDFANAKRNVLEKEIKSTGFYKNKAKNIIASAKKIKKEFNGNIPDSMESLLQLPGVARKTANVVLSTLFCKNEGIVVDTHVKRLSGRLDLSKESNPEKIEKDLMEIIPKKQWRNFSLLLVFHGRNVCNAKKPKCSFCVLKKICPSAFKVKGAV